MSEIWFPLYPERFLSSRKVRRMDAQDVGIYFGLLVEQFLEGGALPDDDRELEIAGRAPIEDVRRVLDLCFTLTDDGWLNETMEQIRDEQAVKMERAQRAGKKGAEVRWKRKAKTPKPQVQEKQELDSNPIATPIGSLCDPNGIESKRESKSKKRKEKNSADAPEFSTADPAHSNGTMQANELIGYWIDQQRTKPPPAQISKQGAAAKRLCGSYKRDELVQAAVGITQLFPHDGKGGQPWDLFDLERKFAKALAAAHQHPDAKLHNQVQDLTAYLEDRDAD